MDLIELVNINIWLGIYIIALFNIKNIQNYNLFYNFLLFISTSLYFIYNQSYVLTGFVFLCSIISQPNYTIYYDLGLILLIITNLYNYNQLFELNNLILIMGTQYSLLYLTNLIFKKYIKRKFPMIEIYTRSIIGSNVLSWGLFTISLLLVYSSLSIKNILGYFIIFCQYSFNLNNPDKQFRSIPNQVITILMEVYSKFIEELNNYKKELEINYKSYQVVGNYIKNSCEIITKPKYKLELGDIIELKLEDLVPATLFLTSESNIYISTIQIDGEKNLKLKMNIIDSDPYIFINNKVSNDYVYNEHNNIIRKNAVIKSTKASGIIVNINNQNITIPKFFELDKMIKNIEIDFVYVTLILFLLNFIMGSYFTNVNLFNTINYFLGIQMINPMSISSIIFIILSNVNKKYINYNGKKQIVATLNNNRLIHCSDKTGTLTCNKFNYLKSIFNPNADQSKLEEYIIRCSTNTMKDPNIIPEEEEYFRKLKIKYSAYEKHNNLVIKNKNMVQLFIGFIDHYKASFNLNVINGKYYLLVQCGEEFAMRFNDKNSVPNLEQIYQYCLDHNINIQAGAPRIWYILKSNEVKMSQDKFNFIVNKYYDVKNDKEQLIKFMNELLKLFKLEYYSAQIMNDQYRDNVRDMITYNHFNQIPFMIITGDNYSASKRISEDLFGSNQNIIYLNKDQQLEFINGKLDLDFKNNFVVCYSSESNIKGDIIKKLKQDDKYRVIYSGDGKNDILALDNADISIGFKDNNDQIDNEISLVSGFIVDNKFWNYYVNNLINDGVEIRNKLAKGIKLLILKQSSITGLMIGYYLNPTNLFSQLSEPFGSREYLMYQILSFLLVIGVLVVKNQKNNIINKNNLIMIATKNIIFNILMSWFNLSYPIYFFINLVVMIYYLYN